MFRTRLLAYALSVDLGDIRHPLRQHVAWHLVSKFVSEFSSLTLRPSDKVPRVGDGACHNASNRRRELVDVGHGRRVDEFILAHKKVSV